MNRDVYDCFVTEVNALTISADDPVAKVVGDLTRAVKRAQRYWYLGQNLCPECAHTYHGEADCQGEPFPDDPGICHEGSGR